MTYKTDSEIDAKYFEFAATPERLAIRMEWGHRAGVAARKRGAKRDENPFTHGPFMPMHEHWYDGWDEAHRETVYGKHSD